MSDLVKQARELAETLDMYGNSYEVIERLAQYEDTNLIPSEITQMQEELKRLRQKDECGSYFSAVECAEIACKLNEYAKLRSKIEDGRMVELPCKVGDTVYRIGYLKCHFGNDDPFSYSCSGCEDECDIKRAILEVRMHSLEQILRVWDYLHNGYYKLTREEAEEALKNV